MRQEGRESETGRGMNRRVKRQVELLLRRSSVSLGMIKPTRLKNEDIIMVREANEMSKKWLEGISRIRKCF